MFLSVGLTTHAASAKETSRDSSVSVEIGRDSTNSTFGSATLDLAVAGGNILGLTVGTNQTRDPATGTRTVSREFGVHFVIHPDRKFSFTPAFDAWGARTDLSSRSLRLDATMNLENWSFGLEPEGRTLLWTTRFQRVRQIRTGAAGLNAHVAYVGLDRWMLQARAGTMNFGGERFRDFVYSYYVTDSAFAGTSGLVKNYVALRASWEFFRDWTLGVDLRRSTYILDGSRSTGFGADVRYAFHPSWLAACRFGTSQVERRQALRSHSLAMTYIF